MLRRWMVSDIKSLVEHVELVGIVHVVVMLEHRHRQALAETTRTDKEEEHVGVFYLFDKSCLVDIITVSLPYINEVHHAVGDTLGVSFLVLCILCHNLTIILSVFMIFRKVMDFP